MKPKTTATEKGRKKTAKKKGAVTNARSGKQKKTTGPIGTGLTDLMNETGISAPKPIETRNSRPNGRDQEHPVEDDQWRNKYKALQNEHKNLKRRMGRLQEKEAKSGKKLEDAQLALEGLRSWQMQARAILNNVAVLLYDARMDSEAIDVFNKILKLDPENQLARENLEMLEQEIGHDR